MNLPVIDMQRTGTNIARIRQARGISVKDLQRMLGFSTPQAIYKWQHGDSLPTLDNLLALCAIFGVSMEEILVAEGFSPARNRFSDRVDSSWAI